MCNWLFVVNGGTAVEPPTCATPLTPVGGVAITDDPTIFWNNDPLTQLYDVYFGKTNVVANMFVFNDLPVSKPYQAQEYEVLSHGYALNTAPNNVLIQPNAINYWFVHQKSCATDPAFVPACTPATYKAAPIPTNDNCAGAILLNEDAVYKTFSSASSTESQAAATCSGAASTTASDVWFKFKTTNVAAPSVIVGVSTLNMDVAVEAFSGTCGALTSVSCVDAVGINDEEILSLSGLLPNTTYYVRVYNFDSNDFLYGEEFDIAVTGNIVIPVELVSFTAKTQGVKNVLNWQTASERNAQSFIVERSTDGQNGFVALGTVKAAGTSATPQYYAFSDDNPLPIAYYRLRQVDLDGKEDVSKIVSVQRKDKKLSLDQAFPSPFKDELTVQYSAERSGSVSLQVVDVLGRVVLSENHLATEGGNLSKLNLHALASGTYILLLSDGQKVAQKRIMK